MYYIFLFVNVKKLLNGFILCIYFHRVKLDIISGELFMYKNKHAFEYPTDENVSYEVTKIYIAKINFGIT